jgi:uncharacterized repeat protein (TIGR01451 family)
MIPGIGRENVRAGPAATVPPVRWRSASLAGVLVLAGAMALPAGAVASTPTISESFSPASLQLNGTSTLTFAITNPDALPHKVIFDDTLPAGLEVVPGSVGSTCGTDLASSGSPSDLAFTDLALSGSSCTVFASVQGVLAGAWDNPVSVTGSNDTDASIDVVAPSSISGGFGTHLLGLDGTTALSFTITNPNPSFALTGVAFTDTLPTGLVIAGQPGDTCAGSVTAVAGTDSVGLSDGQLSPGSSCTVSATVAATTTGALTDTTTQVISTEGGIGDTASAGLTVIGAPTVALSSPVGGHAYAFDQPVKASYSWADDPSGPGIQSCTGTVPDGALINTGKPGEHSFTVTATSQDAGVATDIVFYSVAPDNRFSVAKPRLHPSGSVDYSFNVPGPGRITVFETVSGSRLVFARGSATAQRVGDVRLTLKPSTRGRQALKQRHRLRVTVTVGYTPIGGTLRTASLRLRVV